MIICSVVSLTSESRSQACCQVIGRNADVTAQDKYADSITSASGIAKRAVRLELRRGLVKGLVKVIRIFLRHVQSLQTLAMVTY